MELTEVSAINEITELYSLERNDLRQKKGDKAKMESGRLKCMIEEMKEYYNLTSCSVIKESTIKKRLNTPGRNKFALHRGPLSPLHKFEPKLVQILSLAYNSRFCVSVGQGLVLANSMIHGTKYETEMISYKEKLGLKVEEGSVLCKTYFKNFLNRHKHRFQCMRGHNFLLDRDSWSTYQNFNNMYDHIESILIQCGVTKKYDEPVWLDMNEKVVSEKDSFGQKVTLNFTHHGVLLLMKLVATLI